MGVPSEAMVREKYKQPLQKKNKHYRVFVKVLQWRQNPRDRVALGRQDHNWKHGRKGSRMCRHAPGIGVVWCVKGETRENSNGETSRTVGPSAGNVTGKVFPKATTVVGKWMNRVCRWRRALKEVEPDASGSPKKRKLSPGTAGPLDKHSYSILTSSTSSIR